MRTICRERGVLKVEGARLKGKKFAQKRPGVIMKVEQEPNRDQKKASGRSGRLLGGEKKKALSTNASSAA